MMKKKKATREYTFRERKEGYLRIAEEILKKKKTPYSYSHIANVNNQRKNNPIIAEAIVQAKKIEKKREDAELEKVRVFGRKMA